MSWTPPGRLHAVDPIHPDCPCPFHQRAFVRVIAPGPYGEWAKIDWTVNPPTRRERLGSFDLIWALTARVDGGMIRAMRRVRPAGADPRVLYAATLNGRNLDRLNGPAIGRDEPRVQLWRLPGPASPAGPEYAPRLAIDEAAWWWRPELEPDCWY